MTGTVGLTLPVDMGVWIILAFVVTLVAARLLGSMVTSYRLGPGGMSAEQMLQAERQAEALLQETLSPGETQQLLQNGYLEVPSPSQQGRVYRIPRGRGMVTVYDNGQVVMALCIQPVNWMPTSDVVLMHKLMIEGNEEYYLSTANQFPPYYPFRPDSGLSNRDNSRRV